MEEEKQNEKEIIKENKEDNKNIKNEADNHTIQTTITKASEVIPSSEDFKNPLIKEYLGDKDVRTGILSEARIINGGKYGPSSIVCIDGKTYRSGSEVFVQHTKALIEDSRFPFEVDVKCVAGKNGEYYTLR